MQSLFFMSWTCVYYTDLVSRSGHRQWHCRGLSRGSVSWLCRCFGLIRVLTSSNGAGCHRKDTGGVVCIGKEEADWWLPSALCWNMNQVCNRSFHCKQWDLPVGIWGSESVTFTISPANLASGLWPVSSGEALYVDVRCARGQVEQMFRESESLAAVTMATRCSFRTWIRP